MSGVNSSKCDFSLEKSDLYMMVIVNSDLVNVQQPNRVRVY